MRKKVNVRIIACQLWRESEKNYENYSLGSLHVHDNECEFVRLDQVFNFEEALVGYSFSQYHQSGLAQCDE